MALVKNEVNPLSILRQRKLKVIPEHFVKMTIISEPYVNILKIHHWINFNLNSRYAIIKSVAISKENKLTEAWEIGFESPSELSLFAMACPHLYKK